MHDVSDKCTPYFMPTFSFQMLCDNDCSVSVHASTVSIQSAQRERSLEWLSDDGQTVLYGALCVLICSLYVCSIAPNPTRSISVFVALFNALLLCLESKNSEYTQPRAQEGERERERESQ